MKNLNVLWRLVLDYVAIKEGEQSSLYAALRILYDAYHPAEASPPPSPDNILNEILNLKQQGLSLRQIALKIGCSKATVHKYLKKAAKTNPLTDLLKGHPNPKSS